jgi:hypothetical protein
MPTTLHGQQKALEDLFSVCFVNKNEGWACGRMGTVLHTDNGGEKWTSQNTATDYTLSSIHFVNNNIGWAVGDEGIIIHTENGGRTWEKQGSQVSFFLMGVTFVSPSEGWIVTERTHILHTEDGGKTWQIQFQEDDFILKAISFCDPLNGWVVGEYGLIYHTKDGGKSWVKEAGSFGISESTGVVEGGNQLFGIAAVTPHVAWAVGIDGFVVRTEDGGDTWKSVNVPVPRNPLYCISIGINGAIAIGGKRVFVISDDGGDTWKIPEFNPPITYGWLYGLAQRSNSGFIAVGWEGAIYRNDGGKTLAFWQRAEY